MPSSRSVGVVPLRFLLQTIEYLNYFSKVIYCVLNIIDCVLGVIHSSSIQVLLNFSSSHLFSLSKRRTRLNSNKLKCVVPTYNCLFVRRSQTENFHLPTDLFMFSYTDPGFFQNDITYR